MGNPVSVEMRIRGRVGSEAFLDWICHRARLLDLSGSVRMVGAGEIQVIAHGDAVLVDAMEVACSLGPLDVLVDGIARIPATTPPDRRGFRKR